MERPIVEAIRRHVEAHGRRSRGVDHVCFAARRGCPVGHVAARGGAADGKGYFLWHSENLELGAAIARATGTTVWAYCWENQSGFEALVRFEPDGRESAREEVDWDSLFEEMGAGESEDARRDFEEALPTTKLARELGVPPQLLHLDLAYGTSTCSVPLTGAGGALAGYLEGPLLPTPELPRRESGATQSLFFPVGMADELAALARRLEVPVGTVLWAAWEHAKPVLHDTTPGVPDYTGEEEAEDGPTTAVPGLAAPPFDPPRGIDVPASAPPLPALAEPGGKVMLSLALPERVVIEIGALARHADRSLSWCAQKAVLLSRDRLAAARRDG